MTHKSSVLARLGLAHLGRRLRRRVISLARRESGIALIEFALVAPILITMYLGMVEISMAIGHSRKATLVVRALSDLTTQMTMVRSTDVSAIFAASSAILPPYPLKDAAMRITSIRIDSKGKAFADWSEIQTLSGGTPYAAIGHCTQVQSMVPTALQIPSTTLILAEANVKHTPKISKFVGPVNFKEALPMRPRLSSSVLRENIPTTPCPGEVP